MSSPRVTTSFVLPHDRLEALKKRLPKKGDRSFVIERLIEMFLTNQVKVQTQARTY
jgi:hypothetical protein